MNDEIASLPKGHPAYPSTDSDLLLEVMVHDAKEARQINASLPTEQGVYFLRNKATNYAGGAYEPEGKEVPRDESRRYYRFVSSQGLVANVDGRADSPMHHGGGFPSEYDGSNFADFVQWTREEAGR